ncbi:MAG TPA: aminomethyl-transferring glycine dehydrogenase subunit GcvPA [Candidatus Thermoplasmatota archaeon]|nr:aminomethyl-transferring glycine dehydrogenase subunit GcvPA [Candidatus Thermoplasmatota archaeon]
MTKTQTSSPVTHFLSGESDVEAMFEALGIKDYDELFADVPAAVRRSLKGPVGQTELEVRRAITKMLAKNKDFESRPHFLGAGSYAHYLPAEVAALILRGEFLTSYTPYQPEISQGLLQAMFEYQTYVCRLTGMDVANISVYDGPTAAAEAMLMTVRHSRGKEILLPENLFWEKRSVIENYLKGTGTRIVTYGYDRATGEANLNDLQSKITPETAGLFMENPNFFGVWESRASEVKGMLTAKAPKALFVVGANPISFGLAKGPGHYGADIAVGDGQPLGNPLNYGGPYVGYFACKEDLLRKMPGRIVGETVDNKGRRAYCLTFSTREQHIRRDKATSNICSNEALNALAFSVHLSLLGEEGFRNLATTNAVRARALAARLNDVPGFRVAFTSPFFNEFVVKTARPVQEVERALRRHGVAGGLDVSGKYGLQGHHMLMCVTELHPEWSLDAAVAAFKEVSA